jgi:putative resolvase
MKLSTYAKELGISYTTAWRWWRDGKIEGYQTETGTIIVTEIEQVTPSGVALYARVSSSNQKEDLERQLNRLRNFAASQGLQIAVEISEIASGLNDKRPKLNRLLSDLSIGIIVIEHKDRLTRFGFNYIQVLLQSQNRQILVLNETDTTDELIDDFVSIITSMCVRIYGRRSAKRKAQKVRDCIEQA